MLNERISQYLSSLMNYAVIDMIHVYKAINSDTRVNLTTTFGLGSDTIELLILLSQISRFHQINYNLYFSHFFLVKSNKKSMVVFYSMINLTICE